MNRNIFSSWLILISTAFSLFIATNISSSPASEPESVTSGVGSIKSDFHVTPTGQAHYSIPIEVPPGTAGMVPDLSIVYDSTGSNTRNGLLGMGFSLEGLNAISRCPSNKTQNGLIHGVDFTDQDRFCMNGEQLVVIKGEYGADGAEYRTYTDAKVKIVSYGRQGNGPASFKVWSKAGKIAEYGFTQDSQVKAEGKDTVAVWNLSKIQDTVGNYLEINYFKDETKGSSYPFEIKYTGNKKANLAPYNSIKFVYEDRSDVQTSYQAGSKSSLDKRLKTIQTYQESNLVFEYKLEYEISKNTFRSRITSIQKCTGSGVCLPPTKFEWQQNEEGWERAYQYDLSTGEITDHGLDMGVRFIDLNNDGLIDVVQKNYHRNQSVDSAWINTGSGWKKAE